MNTPAPVDLHQVMSSLPDSGELTARERIEHFEAAILALPQVELHTSHYFADGLYGRELHIPAGTALTGAIHKREHINVLLRGRIQVATENGTAEIQAPAVIVSPPGTKRAGVTLEDTVWLTVHACASRTAEDAWSELVTNDRDEYEASQSLLEQVA